ncbi:C40 family peptidase [Pseudomonas mangrovi]
MKVVDGIVAPLLKSTDTVVPMLKRFAPLVPCALVVLLSACASQAPQPSISYSAPVAPPEEMLDEEPIDFLSDSSKSYELPQLTDSLLAHGLSLVGTRYRYGGSSAETGFDCSGFVGYLFNEEVGLKLPRSTREMINLDAPRVSRAELEPGDVIFFNDRGRGRVSHAGIYLGDDQFIHSSSSRSGGVRVDSLEDSYWKRSYLQAKRVLALAPGESEKEVETR